MNKFTRIALLDRGAGCGARPPGASWALTLLCAGWMACFCAGSARAQEAASPQPAASAAPAASLALSRRTALPAKPTAVETVALTVPAGTPLQIALARDVHVERVGQALRGRVVEPVYAFDKVVIPVGSTAAGTITGIGGVPGARRAEAALDADFSPARKVQVNFTQIVLPDGKPLDIHAEVTPGSGLVLNLAAAADHGRHKGAQDAAAQRLREGKQEIKQEWASARKQVTGPGKPRRAERYLLAQLPFHRQYLDAGTVYYAELQSPLNFGSEPLTPQMAASLNGPPPDGSVVRARLLSSLSSAVSHKGDPVEALVSQPLFDGNRLLVPQGSILGGTVVQAIPAHRPGHNGQLRIVFHELRLPGGVSQKVDALLQAVQADKSAGVKLDSEGGAQASAPASRFLTTGLTVGLGAFSFIGDSGGGDMAHSSAGGAGGYKLIGIALGLATSNQMLGMAMGAYGGARSIYSHFIARGQEVVFPKDTAMAIGLAAPHGSPTAVLAPAATKPSRQ